MACSSCGGGSVVVKTETTAPLFTLTRGFNRGDRVDVTHRSGYAGHGIVRRVYLANRLELIDCWMEATQSMITVTVAKGDRISLLPVAV